MTDSPLFKRAYVRGLNAELIRASAVFYPSKEAADYAADYIADNSQIADPYQNPNAVTKEASAQLCHALVKAGGDLCKEAGGHLPELTKTAQASDPTAVANSDAWALMEKAAADTGSLMEGGDEANDQPAAASSNAEAALEANRRPENYANMGEDGVGNYERKGQGNVGVEEDHPEKPSATESGSNSNIENTRKHGQLKLAMPPEMGAPPEAVPPEALGGGMPPGVAEAAAAPDAPELSPDLIKGVELGVQLAAEDPEAAAAILEGGAGGEEAPPMAAEPPPPAMAPPEAPPMGGPPKEASLAAIVQKIAAGNTGALIEGGEVPNDQPAAVSGNAQSPGNAEAALEANRRPENYANKGEDGVGRSDFIPSKEENVGRERPHPEAPKATDKGKTNVPLEHIKGAFDQLFESTASKMVPYLPTGMEDQHKVAHIRAAMGLDTAGQADYLENLYVQFGHEKIAAEGVKTHFLSKAATHKDGEECPKCHKVDCDCPPMMGKEISMTKKEGEVTPPTAIKQASVQSLGGLRTALHRLRAS